MAVVGSKTRRETVALGSTLWRGEDLSGKTILLRCEQGFGDTLQFARYAPAVKACGAKIILQAPAQLLPLLKSLAGVDALIGPDVAAPAFDVHAPLLSLPGIFGARPTPLRPARPPISRLIPRWSKLARAPWRAFTACRSASVGRATQRIRWTSSARCALKSYGRCWTARGLASLASRSARAGIN